ncbi:transposase [Streptomyces sp. MK7]|uniref:transposase n=1 Tax=Streptomyces sp. MK7 TaxID=3067635 RepID=UPI0037D9AA61
MLLPLLTPLPHHGGRRRNARQLLEVILHIACTRQPWTQLPHVLGPLMPAATATGSGTPMAPWPASATPRCPKPTGTGNTARPPTSTRRRAADDGTPGRSGAPGGRGRNVIARTPERSSGCRRLLARGGR